MKRIGESSLELLLQLETILLILIVLWQPVQIEILALRELACKNAKILTLLSVF